MLTRVTIELASFGEVIKDFEMTQEKRRRKLWEVGILLEPFVMQLVVKKSDSGEHPCDNKCLYRS